MAYSQFPRLIPAIISLFLTNYITSLMVKQSAQAVSLTNCTESGLRTAINNTPDGGTVTFNCPPDTIINLTSEINLSKNLTFDGTNSTRLSISGQNRTRIFRTNKNLTLKNLALIQGNITTQNTSFSCDGGAVLITFGTLTINNVIFRANRAVRGGAICGNYQAKISIVRGVFTGNRANQGGAIFTNTTDLNINRSKFQNNITTAQGKLLGTGGAIYTYGILTTTQPIVISDSRFTGNTAQHEGGALFISQSNGIKFILRNSVLANNKALINNNTGIGSGGAVRINHSGSASLTTINNVVFANNTADQEGGALWVGGANAFLNLNMKKVTFAGNTSGKIADQVNNETGGGAMVLVNGANATINLDQITFVRNTAENHETSGAFYPANITANNTIITNSIFYQNCSRKDLPGTPTVENCTHLVHALASQPFNDQGNTNNFAWIVNANAATGVRFPLTRNIRIRDVKVRTYQDNGDLIPDHPCSDVASGSGGQCVN